MMKTYKTVLIILSVISLNSCFEDLDDNFAEVGEINDFIWTAMNAFYVYKDEIPDLANDRFNNRVDYADYLNSFGSPEDLFSSLIYERDEVDRFSTIFPNFVELEQLLQGTNFTSGMNYGLRFYPGDETRVFGYVRYVLQGTPAESQGVERGMIFNAVDGVQLTPSNFRELLIENDDVFSINLATYSDNGTPEDISDDVVTPRDDSILLAKIAFTPNPIQFANVLEVNGQKIGYLMYNGFRASNISLTQLNALFDFFRSQGVSDLVLDLRYNGGGSVSAAVWLSCMITGQFTNQLFFSEQWNNDAQSILEMQTPGSLNNLFVDEMIIRNTDGDVTFQQGINSLNMSKVYVLTTRSTASASELVINGLRPYIDVVQIGTTTQGKPQASITLYDSENFTRNGTNPSHTYAIQPLIYEAANATGFSSYYGGLAPTPGLEQAENFANMGSIGDVNEPYLARAIQLITGSTRVDLQYPQEELNGLPVPDFDSGLIEDRPHKLNEARAIMSNSGGSN